MHLEQIVEPGRALVIHDAAPHDEMHPCRKHAAWVFGRSTGTPTLNSGAVTMKTTSNTSITSTKGVTLISAIGR